MANSTTVESAPAVPGTTTQCQHIGNFTPVGCCRNGDFDRGYFVWKEVEGFLHIQPEYGPQIRIVRKDVMVIRYAHKHWRVSGPAVLHKQECGSLRGDCVAILAEGGHVLIEGFEKAFSGFVNKGGSITWTEVVSATTIQI
jgi:hypothetical protein